MNRLIGPLGLVAVCVLLVLTIPLVAQAAPIGPTPPPGASPEDIAKAHIEANRPDLAIKALKDALAKTPAAPRLHYWLGVAYVQNGEPDLAEGEFRTVLQEDSDFVEAHIQLVNLAVRKVSFVQPKSKNLSLMEGAIRELAEAIKKNPQDTKLYYTLAGLYADSTQFREQTPELGFTEAVRVLQDVQKRTPPEEPRPHVALGDTRTRHADSLAAGKKFSELTGDTAKKCNELLDTATADYRRALTINPRLLIALDRIAAIQNARGDVKAAVKTFEDQLPKLETPMEKAVCYRSMAIYLMRNKELGDAEAKLNEAIKAEPREFLSYLLLADVLVQRDMAPVASDTLAKALKVDANFLNAHVQLGLLELRRGGLGARERAAEHFQNALNIPPARARVVTSGDRPIGAILGELYALAAVRLGEILVGQAKFDDALAVFQKLAVLLPNSPIPEYQIGEVYRQRNQIGDKEAAREHYENALRRDKKFVQALAMLAELDASEVRFATSPQDRAKKLTQAIDQLESALESVPDSPVILDRLADLRVQLANTSAPKDRAVLERALANAKKAAELAPDAIAIHRRLAFIHYEMGNKTDAVAELKKLIDNGEKALQKEPENVTTIFLLADLRTTLHAWQPDPAVLKQSIDGFALAVKKQPQFFQAYLGAAMLLEQQKDYKNAADWYKKLLDAAKGESSAGALLPEPARFALNAAAELAWIYCEYVPDLEQAKKYAKVAMEIDSSVPALLDTIGWIYYKEDKPEEAIPNLRRAFKAMPTNATIGYHLGAALIKNKNADRAREALTEALKNVGDDAELKGKIETLLKSVGT